MNAVVALEADYLTVTEAAALLRVAPSTIRRWIREGELPAYRLGQRRVALRRDDLSRLIRPVRTGDALNHAGEADELERTKRRRLRPEEVKRRLVAFERAQQHREELQAQRDGRLFPDSVEIIHRMREERTRQLMEAMGWDDLR